MISNTILTVTTPAADRRLLTAAELRAAVGVSGDANDAELDVLGLRVADVLATSCLIRRGGVAPPTFRQETVTEKFTFSERAGQLMLSRTPIASITSIVEKPGSDPLVADTDYEVDVNAGMVYRLHSGRRSWWGYYWGFCADDPITVIYQAGWATVPEPLKMAAAKFVQSEWATSGTGTGTPGRDPNLKRLNVPGVADREWWVDPKTDTAIPAEVMDILNLGGFINHWRA